MEGLEDDFHERKIAYVRERSGDPNADDSHHLWHLLANEFELFHGDIDYISEWEVEGKTRREIFYENLEAAESFLDVTIRPGLQKRLLVMLYGHVVASIEAFLYSTFLHYVLASDRHMTLFIESDDELGREKFTVREFNLKRDGIRGHVTAHVKTKLIFHRVEKIMVLYKKVLNVDFGDVKWLTAAVSMRHHCVHRAGYDEDGTPVKLSVGDVRDLIDHAEKFGLRIERELLPLPDPEEDQPF